MAGHNCILKQTNKKTQKATTLVIRLWSIERACVAIWYFPTDWLQTHNHFLFHSGMIPHLTAALRAAINGPLLVIPVLNSIVVAEGRPPQLNGQLFVLFSLEGGERSLVSSSFSLGVICDTLSGAHAKGLGVEATDHFADAVLERGHDGAQAPQLQDHAGQLITGHAADGLQVLRLVANVVSADGRAGAVYHIVVEGEKDIGGAGTAFIPEDGFWCGSEHKPHVLQHPLGAEDTHYL